MSVDSRADNDLSLSPDRGELVRSRYQHQIALDKRHKSFSDSRTWRPQNRATVDPIDALVRISPKGDWTLAE
jgi:hypothetical protein